MLEKFVHRVVLAKPKDFRDKDRAHTPPLLLLFRGKWP
jgi:hypothetical protein